VRQESWFIAHDGDEETLIAFVTYDDFGRAVKIFSESKDAFDVWFKERLNACTGVDLNDPPALVLPQLASHYPRSDA
jgi:hypothetical protein